jgi:hypothetical protein
MENPCPMTPSMIDASPANRPELRRGSRLAAWSLLLQCGQAVELLAAGVGARRGSGSDGAFRRGRAWRTVNAAAVERPRGWSMRAAGLIAVAVSLALASCAGATNCPSEAEVRTALQHYVETDLWSPAERDIWKITDVSGFEFAPMKTGRIIQKQVEYGRSAEDVCPVRIEYSFKATHADGRVETTAKGKDQTHLFYRNGFDEWVFKVE